MKSLSLSRPLLIMMLGVPGSGKSFFARKFVETFSTPMVSYDEIRMTLFAQPGYSKDEEEIVSMIAAQQARELIKTQKSFVVDGGMSTKQSRQALESLAKKQGYMTLVIWTQIDTLTARVRATRRNAKKDGDQLNTSLSIEKFEDLSRALTPPGTTENHIVISGKHTFATQAKVVLKKLLSSSPRTETITAPPATKTVAPPPRSSDPRRGITVN